VDGARPHASVRVLGPVEVVGPAGAALLPGSRQRALVGLLALRAGGVVPRESLVDALWGEDPPRTALKTLYSHVTRARQAIEACGLPGLLTTREPGYALAVSAAQVDARLFEDLVRQAGGAPAETAATHLRAGLDLWRGDAFADSALAGWGAAEITRLREVRLTATEDLWEARLRLGSHGPAVAELEPLAAAHPYRERLVGLLMLALYRCGRHADALDRYQRLRAHLAEELGVDPAPDLQRRYAAILRHDRELDFAPDAGAQSAQLSVMRPAQLPAPVGHFTGRAGELAAMSAAAGDGETRIVAVSGPAGMGKTALALQWAHQVKDRFPDGQLYLDLRGHDREAAMPAGEALPHLLRSLGVPPDRVPATVDEQAGLYRSLLHGKRCLVVLDNCRDADQVLALVPGNGSSLLVVTSRGQLTALATRHAVRLVGLDVLDAAEALALVRRVCGADRVDREPAPAAELVELCGRMPLALRIAAATLGAATLGAGVRDPIGALTARLTTENRLDAFAIEGDSRSVRAAFASAYHSVSPPAARLFRLLGLHPGQSLSAHLCAAVTGSAPRQARALLTELAAAHLVADAGPDRYRCHDLIRLYAHECAQHEEPPAGRAETVERILDWYLALGQVANRTLQPSRNRVVPDLRHPPGELPEAGGILAFLDGERGNVTPVIRYAAERGHPRAAWQLTYLLAGFFECRGHWSERLEMCRHAVAAARLDGDEFAESLMCGSLGAAYATMHRHEEAVGQLLRSLELARATGDLRGQGNAHNNLAAAYVELNRPEEAIESFRRALELYDGQAVPTALTLNNLGEMYVRTGRPELGFDHLSRALALVNEVGEPRLVAAVTHSIGQAHLRCGNHPDAERYLRQALRTRHEIGDQRYAAETLTYLGMAYLSRASTVDAVQHLRQAVAISRAAGDEHLEATARNHLGRALAQAGDPGLAAEQFRLALTLRARVPDAEEEAGIRRNLAALAQEGQPRPRITTLVSALSSRPAEGA
jgi:DNA-binding SARP family transcriptional activator/Tfp pilus assembly protein PilF